MAEPKLTIGIASFDDYDGVYFTLQALRSYHSDVIHQAQLLVVDHNPRSRHGELVRELIAWIRTNAVEQVLRRTPPADHKRVNSGEIQDCAAKYIAVGHGGIASPYDRVFRHADAPHVLYLDPSILIEPGVIRRLIEYFDANPDCRDLLSGPLVHDSLAFVSTHLVDRWQRQMRGIRTTDARGMNPRGDPFEIPAQRLELFACSKAAWPGLNARFRGFGGAEFYIHEKIRRAGGRCLCLPFLRWLHRSSQTRQPRYPLEVWNNARNYVIGNAEFGLPLDEIEKQFV